jgi:hypothetical protein
MTASSFIEALDSGGPATDRADKMKLYGWLIGRCVMDATVYRDDGGRHQGPGEIHFGWVLEGRAVQDVWILPGVFYGTTLRVYDPTIDAWHILWSDPVRQVYTRQIGRAHGDDIVQHGKNDSGEAVRWSFTNITPDSFRWIGEHSRDDGTTWQLRADFLARRGP